MPKRSWRCPKCGDVSSGYIHATDMLNLSCNKCKHRPLDLLPPRVNPPDVTEVVDSYKNISWRDGQQDDLRERSEVYYWSVLVPEMVRSGTYCMQTMIENGWVYFDDKGDMHIRTSPPNR